MFKRFLSIFVLLIFASGAVFAQDIPVKIEALSKISTSDVKIKEGDNINFVVAEDVFVHNKLYIKKGEVVSGLITSLVDNGFTCQEASIYVENFKVRAIDKKLVKLSGVVYQKGRTHWMFTQFIPVGYVFIRGGEAQIEPKKDTYTLYLGVGDDL